MIIDAHSHASGPERFLRKHFRDVTTLPPGVPPVPLTMSDDEIDDSLTKQLGEVAAIGTDMQLIVGRPWAIPTATRNEVAIMYITEQVNDLFARCVALFPDRFAAMATLPQVVGVNPRNCVEELERCVTELGFVGCKINCDPGEGGIETPDLGNEWWYSLYEKMTELDVPALLHGGPFNFSREPELGYYPAEVTTGALNCSRPRTSSSASPTSRSSSDTVVGTSRTSSGEHGTSGRRRTWSIPPSERSSRRSRTSTSIRRLQRRVRRGVDQGDRGGPGHLRNGPSRQRRHRRPTHGPSVQRREVVHRRDSVAQPRGAGEDFRAQRASCLLPSRRVGVTSMIVDTHSHLAPPPELTAYLSGFSNVAGAAGRSIRPFPISDDRLDEVIVDLLARSDASGIDLQLIGVEPSVIPTADRRSALVATVTRRLNDLTAQLVALHPDRFAGIGVLPQSPSIDPAGVVAEMERCISEHGFVGFEINPDPGEGDWEAPELAGRVLVPAL